MQSFLSHEDYADCNLVPPIKAFQHLRPDFCSLMKAKGSRSASRPRRQHCGSPWRKVLNTIVQQLTALAFHVLVSTT